MHAGARVEEYEPVPPRGVPRTDPDKGDAVVLLELLRSRELEEELPIAFDLEDIPAVGVEFDQAGAVHLWRGPLPRA